MIHCGMRVTYPWRSQGHLEELEFILFVKINQVSWAHGWPMCHLGPHEAWLSRGCKPCPPFLISYSLANAILSALLSRYPHQIAEGLGQGCHGLATRVLQKAQKSFPRCLCPGASLAVPERVSTAGLRLPPLRGVCLQGFPLQTPRNSDFRTVPTIPRTDHCVSHSLFV